MPDLSPPYPGSIVTADPRRYFYLQLRQDVATGQLKLTSKQAIKLTAYSLQADHGDYVDFETTAMHWRERPAVSESALAGASELCNVEHVDDIIWGYCQLRGVSQDHAIWYYLNEIRRLSSYGVQLFYGSTSTAESAELGVSRNGLTISTLCPTNSSVSKLKWEEIKDLAYSRKTFTIQLLKKAKSILFIFDDTQEARYLWNFCIQMHNSYIHYWSHVKAGSLQPIAHVSEPPDILRGTGLHLPNSASSPIGELKVYQTSTSAAGESKTDRVEISGTASSAPNTVTGSMDSSHVVTPTNQLKETLQHQQPAPTSQATPVQLTSSCMSAVHSEPREMNGAAVVPPLPGDSGQSVNPAIGSDSEGGTLLGHWSMRSAADTMDSQMLGNHCVACLPVTVCLRNSTGSGSSSKHVKVRHTNQKAKSTLTNTRSLPQPDERRRSHHHHSHHKARKHHSQKDEGTVLFRKKVTSLKSSTPAEEAAARYNLSLTETSSGTSSESEFEADICSTSAETSSSSNSSASPRRSLSPTSPSNGFRRLLIHSSGVTSGATAAVRPMLASFGQHHYRLQQHWNRTKVTKQQPESSDTPPSQQLGQRSNESKASAAEGHGWLASARRFTSALSESLSRRALPLPVGGSGTSSVGCHGNANKLVLPSSTPPVMPRENTKSVGIAQVIRPEHSESNNQQQQQQPPTQQQSLLEGQSVAARKPCRPPMPPSKLTTNQRGTSAGPGSTTSGISYPPVPAVLHHSLYEAESRPQIRLQPPSPPQQNITGLSPEDQRHGKMDWKSNSDPAHTEVCSRSKTDSASQSWHLVRHPVWMNRVGATAAATANNRTGADASKFAETIPSSGIVAPATASVTPFSAYFSLQTSENGTTGCLSAPDGAPDGFHISWGAARGNSEVPLGNSAATPVTSPEPSLAFTVELKGEQLLTPLQQMSSSVSSSSSSSSSAVAATRIFSNSSSPSSLASSFGGSPKLLLDKESSSSTMSYSACNERNFCSLSQREQHQQQPAQMPLERRQQSRAQPLPRKLPPLQQPRQRSLSGASGSGPLHLLTNSDIHQLLNLTKMRETALVHRLLAEYRQTLLLQQSLHANSVSTPNLTASQELRTTVSPLAVEYTRSHHPEDKRDGDRWQTSGVCFARHRTSSKAMETERSDRLLQANSLGSENRACQGCGCNNVAPSSSLIGARTQNHEHQSSDFADYVNAAAFQCPRNPRHVASALSTTDNDSNATFRVLSEVDARTSYSNNGGFSISSTRASTKETSGVPFNHEDSGTTSDLMTISSGWKTTPRFSTTANAYLDSKMQQQQPTTCCFKPTARGLVKADLPELVAGLPASPQSQYHQKSRHPHLRHLEKGSEDEGETEEVGVEEERENEVGGEGEEEEEEKNERDKRYSSSTFSSPQPTNDTFKCPRSRISATSAAQLENLSMTNFMRTSISRSALTDEYENLEMDSPPLSSTNLRSTTDVSTKSSASDGSFEDYGLLTEGGGGADDVQQAKCHPRTYRRRRRLTATATTAAGTPRPTRPTRLSDRRFSEGNDHSTARRVTLPHTSCDSSSHQHRGLTSPVQLCRQHLRALEHLSEVQKPREPRQRSPTPLVRRKRVCCHCRCHAAAPADRPASPRYSTQPPLKRPEKARSYDPFLPTSKSHSHHLSRQKQQRYHHHHHHKQQQRYQHQHLRTHWSVSPAGECLKDCSRHSLTRGLEQRETTTETCAICRKRRCKLCNPINSLDLPDYADERGSPVSSSRVASDSSLTSIPATLKDVMVSSYEYEFPSQHVGRSLNRAASSFDSLITGPQRNATERDGKLSTHTVIRQRAVNTGDSRESLERACAGGNNGERGTMYTGGRSRKPPLLAKHCASSTSEMQAPLRGASKTGRRPCNLGLCAHEHERTRGDAPKDRALSRPVPTREPTAKRKSKLTSCANHGDCPCRTSNDGSTSSESPPSLGLHKDDSVVANINRPKTLSVSASHRDGRYLHQQAQLQRPALTALTPAWRTVDHYEPSQEKKQQQHLMAPASQPSPSSHMEAYLPPRAVRPPGGFNLQLETLDRQWPSSQLQRQRNPGGGLLFTASMTFTPSSSAGCSPYHTATSSPLAETRQITKSRGSGGEHAGALRESEGQGNDLCQSWESGVGTTVRPHAPAELQSHGQRQSGGVFQRALISKPLRSEQEEVLPSPRRTSTPSEPPLTNFWR
nr:unnamed protein product [Spirometra erinaceieuropaei]